MIKVQRVAKINTILSKLAGKKLPYNRDVLGVFIRYHVEEKMTIRESTTKTAPELILI